MNLYVIKRKKKLTDRDKEKARDNGCDAICNGIPPRLAYILHKSVLPLVFDESEPLALGPTFAEQYNTAKDTDERLDVLARMMDVK